MRLSADDRCRIQIRELLKPNTAYDAQFDVLGRIVLTELVSKSGPVKFESKAEVAHAIKSSRLKFGHSWDLIRKDTREH